MVDIVAGAAEVIEKVKDKFLPAVTYQTKAVKFKNKADLVRRVLPGDVLTLCEESKFANLVPGTSCEVVKVDEKGLVHLKDGKIISAEWFDLGTTRRERVRRKVDMALVAEVADMFSRSRWQAFSANIDNMLAQSKTDIEKAEVEVKRAQARLDQCRENAIRLEAARSGGEDSWIKTTADRMAALVEAKLYTNFDIFQADGKTSLTAYTGVINTKDGAGTKRQEYAVMVRPATEKPRVLVENITPGHAPSNVPFNEGRTGPCNICFGEQESDLQVLIDDEDWSRVLTIIRAYLEGNRRN